jgi:putative radical SAM enzyme (TIGR03279 family)
MEVIKASIADAVGLEPGDTLLSINGQPVEDLLDYQFYSQDDNITLVIEKKNGETWSVDIEKDFDDELGLLFEGVVFDRIRLCRNRCMFCFIDQMPPAMRETLYVKDDDYRYSFLFGNYITLTNLSDDDWNKLESMRLSPLYVSVHTTSGPLRQQMMKNPRAAHIMEDLQRLKQAGIQVHTQIVLCPDLNDGQELVKSINELADLYPSVQSVGIVPVGLTGHRDKLPHLRTFTAQEARELIEEVNQWRNTFRSRFGIGFVYLADEFYVKAGIPVPPADYYDAYSQIENGIGLIRLFMDDWQEIKRDLPNQIDPVQVFLITGESARTVMQTVAEDLNRVKGLGVEVIVVPNQYFGGGVTVTGLLTGTDIINCLQDNYRGKKVVIPEVLLQEGSTMLLDNITLEEIASRTGVVIRTTDGSARSLVEAVLY